VRDALRVEDHQLHIPALVADQADATLPEALDVGRKLRARGDIHAALNGRNEESV
jgi:hypothetical protein